MFTCKRCKAECLEGPKCAICLGQFDFPCSGITEGGWRKLGERKNTWKCMYCKLQTQSSPRPTALSAKPTTPQPVFIDAGDADSDNTLTKKDFVDFKHMMLEQVQKMNDMISGFQQSMSFFNDIFEDMKKSLEDKSSRIKQLEKHNSELIATLEEVSKRLDNVEQQSRSSNLEIQCVPEHKSENVITTVLHLGSVVGCKVTDSDILYASRVAKLDSKSKRPRSIIVKLSTPRVRDSLLAATIKYNKNHPGEKLNSSHLGIAQSVPQPIYITEHLSMRNKALHAAARIRAKELGYKFVWVRNGRIFMRKTDSSQCFCVLNNHMLDALA